MIRKHTTEKDLEILRKAARRYTTDNDSDGYSARNSLGDLVIIDKLTELSTAFNAQTAAIKRQNELQEKMLVALEAITKSTAPKVKIVDKSQKNVKL